MDKKIINSSLAPEPIGPYSQAVYVNNMLFVSGQIAASKAAEGNIENETQAVMENIKHILKEANLDFKNVVKTSIFLKDLGNFDMVNIVYGSYFTDAFPARETIVIAVK
jgi:2-iminobutanoate/2-iminopropanoate deaminase